MEIEHYIPDDADATTGARHGVRGPAPAAAHKRRVALVAAVALVFCGAMAAGALALRSTGAARPDDGNALPAQAERVAPRPIGSGCATCGTVELVRATASRGTPGTHRITIRMDDGSYRTISQPRAPGIGPGEKVRIVDGVVVPGG
ncbi:MAG: hypothetical protein KJ025_07115 [Burkholderiales bacterium]|nr:hypothetical protein [Burkholderiales bacterium]